MSLKISEEAKVQMPMKTVASLIAIVGIGVWGYFGIVEKLNIHIIIQERTAKKYIAYCSIM